MEQHPKDAIQIIPGQGWYAIYDVNGKEERTPIVAWELQRGGDIVPLTTDSNGVVYHATVPSNFKKIKHDRESGWGRQL